MTDQPAHTNHLWATIIIEELFRRGVQDYFISPGSRSTPLVLAAVKHPQVQTTIHFDERGSSFAALGFAKYRKMQSGTNECKVGWICTSGTALANALPATIEAFMSHTPLLLLTADRPPELKNLGANQTINQDDLFKPYLRSQTSLEEPRSEVHLHKVISEIRKGLNSACQYDAGPVHLNLGFRKPLQPELGNVPTLGDVENSSISSWLETDDFQKQEKPRSVKLSTLDLPSRTLALASGSICLDDFNSFLRFTLANGYPLVLDASCPFSATEDNVLSYIDFYPEKLVEQVDCVIHLGDRVSSKNLQEALNSYDKAYHHIGNHSAKIDPGQVVSHFHKGIIEQEEYASNKDQDRFKDRFSALDEEVDIILTDQLGDVLTEPAIMRTCFANAPKDIPIWIGNSLAIRQFESFAQKSAFLDFRGSNRGVSGIDGQIASACGFAKAAKKRGLLILGDLGFLHDLNSLNLLRDTPMTLIVVNNDGGGIFSMLPIAEYAEIFEEYFATPHNLKFEHGAKLFGLDYHAPKSKEEFISLLKDSFGTTKTTVIELTTSRSETKAISLDIGKNIREQIADFS